MRILLIGPSPYLHTRNGRIVKDLMLHWHKEHQVSAMVWHHDVQYFLPQETGKHFFEHKREKISELYPFLGEKGAIAPFAFETMKAAQPKVVITVGDYVDTEFVWSIKSVYPHLFKWIAILPYGTDAIDEQSYLSLSYADRIITTTAVGITAFEPVKTAKSLIPYGPCHQTFYPVGEKPKDLRVLNVSKNSQFYNVPAFLDAIKGVDVSATLHVNMDDGGDYDLRRMIDCWGLNSKVEVAKQYLSLRDGFSDDEMNNLYNRHNVIVDCSVQSSTGISVLEAMSTGCIPVGMDIGALHEIFELLPEEFRFLVPYGTFWGSRGEKMSIISAKDLAHVLEKISRYHVSDPLWVESCRKKCIEVSKNFSRESFITRVSEIVKQTEATEHCISVDSF